MTLSALGIFSAAGAGGVGATYELIQTQILTTTESSIVFSNLGNFSTTYKHLQLRFSGRTNGSYTETALRSRFNADAGNNYVKHFLLGDGSTVSSALFEGTSSSNALTGLVSGSLATTNSFFAGYVDLLDFASTTKNKTTRALSGGTGGVNRIDLHSGLWMNTNAVTSWTLFIGSGSFIAGSRFSLYGIRG